MFFVDLIEVLHLMLLLLTECPRAADDMERFACPTPDRQGRYHCIDDHVLCDGFVDCPSGEDEDRQACMFYKTVSLLVDQRIQVQKVNLHYKPTATYHNL